MCRCEGLMLVLGAWLHLFPQCSQRQDLCVEHRALSIQLDYPASLLRDLIGYCLLTGGITDGPSHWPGIDTGPGDLNSGPHTCRASVLSTEPSSQYPTPAYCFKIQFSKHNKIKKNDIENVSLKAHHYLNVSQSNQPLFQQVFLHRSLKT